MNRNQDKCDPNCKSGMQMIFGIIEKSKKVGWFKTQKLQKKEIH